MKLNQLTKLGLVSFVAITNLIINQALVDASEQNQTDIAKLFDQAAKEHKRELRSLWNARASEPPVYRLNATSENVAKVLSLYPDKSAVLFYSFNKNKLQIWLVNQNGIQAYHRRKISVNQINEVITNFRNSLGVDSLQLTRTPRRRGIKVTQAYDHENLPINRTKSELTKILLPTPIQQKLNSVKHLIISPVLGLGTVPYALLQPFKDNSYLIDKMSISIAPSLFDLNVYIYPWYKERAFSSSLIVGNPYLAPSNKWVVPPLSGAEKEARAVAKKLNTTPLIGKEASKKTIISKMPSSSLIYFATHGIANNYNPLIGSFLMFSSETFEQGWLSAKQIQELNLKADIAILSACQTGLGKSHKAGIIGLARAFQIAGVPRIVMSLWSIDDAATNKLMQAFVKYLEDDIPAEALRKAMVEVKEQGHASSQWGAFALFGTPR